MGKERGKVNPERVRQRFSREFKLEAVRLLEHSGKPATQLAMELGIQLHELFSHASHHSPTSTDLFCLP